MKKITFILFALMAGTIFAQESATGEATAFADIVSPITITDGSDLLFGKIIKDATGGTVIIGTDDSRSGTAQVVTATTSPVSAAKFTVTATEDYSYTITLPSTVELSNGTNTMDVTNFKHNLGDSPKGTGGNQALHIGGTLGVNPSQQEGNYKGNFNVTVSYE